MSLTDNIFSAGYVLIRAGNHDVHTIRDELLKIEGVWIAHALIGPDDLICYVDRAEPSLLRKTLNQGIRRMMTSGMIEHTETLIIFGNNGSGYSGEENKPAPAAAWLLCDVSVSDPEIVIKELRDKKLVVNAHPVLGRYDMIAYVEATSMDELMRILDEDIRHIEGIRSTDTRLVLMKLDRALPARARGRQLGVSTA
jgi:hypothetical protein